MCDDAYVWVERVHMCDDAYVWVERVHACDDAYVLSGNGGCTGW